MSTALKRGATPWVVHRTIKVRPQRESEARQIAEAHQLHPVAARVLAARGYSVGEELRRFLSPTLKDGLPSPDRLKNLSAACALIAEHIRAGNAIAICCDFDVDGLSGGAQVFEALRTIGARVKAFVPDRFADGYGLNERMVREIAASGFSLMVTIDYGTTNERELSLARELGLKTIVIDHHHVGDHKPPTDVFINPQQADCKFADGTLSAAGLAWYLIVGLRRELDVAEKLDARSYLELACLGTICDMVPLIGANRVIAKRGLELLTQSRRPGLVALKNVVGVNGDVSCSHISFGIGPRLNAAGRMVHGEMVLDLLTTSDSVKAKQLAMRLNKLNVERQEIEHQVKEHATQLVLSRGELPWGIVVGDESFHTGVVGIVAQRLVETFYRPAVVLGLDSPGMFKGSVRGIRGFSVVAALHAVGEHLEKFGGHEGAGGLSVREERLESFVQAFEQYCEEKLRSIETSPSAEADTEAELADVSRQLIEQLRSFAPFGIGNPAPQLLFRGLKVTELRVLKDTHLKLTLQQGGHFMRALWWRQTSHPALKVGATVDVIARPELSTFNGVTELQLTLSAAR